MLNLNDLKSMELASATPGHLVLTERGLTMVAKYRDRIVTVLLDPTDQCTIFPVNNTNSCVDFGAAQIRCLYDAAAISSRTEHSRPGSVAIDADGTWIICRTANQEEMWLHVSDGILEPRRGSSWFVPRWEIGVHDADGSFLPLYKVSP